MTGLDIRPRRRSVTNSGDCNQGQAQIAHFPEKAMQRGLIDDRALQGGGSVTFVSETESFE
ncbi:MAG: hypothetical protein IT318_09005 [Anaerolineales bacterium]|nr:hypothetical protein [Anaerolineales bacterium]